jgi:hypothetical protein
MKMTQIILFLMLPLAALSPLLQPIDVELENKKSVNSAEKSSHLVVVNPNVHWTFSAGDFAIFNGSIMSEEIRSDMENSSDFDRAEVNWNTNSRVDLLGDAYCSFPAYIGLCHRSSISYQMNVTAYNDTDNFMLMMNMSIGNAVFIPTTYTGWEKGEESGHSRMWMKEQGGNEDMYRSTSWENSTSETYITGYKENITVGDIWSENEKEWSNWTSESNDEYNAGGGNWVPSTSNDAGSDFEEENETANATREVTIQSPGYNLADSSGSGPTSITGIEVEYWNDAGELDETVVLGEWGYPLDLFGGPLLSWKYVNGVWVDADNDGVHDSTDLCLNTPVGFTGLDADGCSWEQRDEDSDSVLNPNDNCANTTASMTDIDANGCAWEQRDDDGDTILNPNDHCPATPANETVDTEPPWQGCSASQKDTDNDGVTDDLDQCQGFNDSIDVDLDGIPDGCDSMIDNDGDGVNNTADLCPGFDDAIDVDQDGVPDGCDDIVDSDFDGVADADDECMGYDDTIDVDGDGIVDGCDAIIDSDGDGVADSFELCPGHDDNVDVDADGKPDGCDDIVDSDNDGVSDANDTCAGHDDSVDVDGDEIADGCDNIIDSDGDGVADVDDKCAGFDDNIDIDNDQTADGCDTLLDNDADGIANENDDCLDTPSGTEIDSTGCEKPAAGLAGGIVTSPIMIGGIIGVVGVVVLIAAITIMRRGKDDDDNEGHESLFNEPRSNLEFTGAGMPTRGAGVGHPISGAPAMTSTPHPSQVGKTQSDGYEYLEHPPNSETWWYRDQNTNHWMKYQG